MAKAATAKAVMVALNGANGKTRNVKRVVQNVARLGDGSSIGEIRDAGTIRSVTKKKGSKQWREAATAGYTSNRDDNRYE